MKLGVPTYKDSMNKGTCKQILSFIENKLIILTCPVFIPSMTSNRAHDVSESMLFSHLKRVE